MRILIRLHDSHRREGFVGTLFAYSRGYMIAIDVKDMSDEERADESWKLKQWIYRKSTSNTFSTRILRRLYDSHRRDHLLVSTKDVN
ncbi:hypothetical protein HYFRA_00012543 [Hymenoscyphus fraxineus]|uniref:Uncharacterized protein n=1 Tax=Hymenoscyphus fraxineus TaxID=746836 RepID=A0A9N9L3D3_9HELO|nr:hypothetical protein HYFRA_00012543 [Hymenoscyphus fraxineus]